jgi:L-fuculose-phosphate aldolase
MLSKADLEAADICLSDLNGKILAGDRTLTSELLLHLEIYKANPRAKAVVHCHPPYATAFAVTGTLPPMGLIPEYEVFIGPAAVAPYETPGTQAFADTILPFVHEHNTILLKNHGVVCWADTVTHAEWLCEIMDTYCKTYLIAKQIGAPLGVIPDEKIDDILRRKQWMGLPDARMGRIGGDPCGGEAKNTAEIVELVKRETGRRR